MRSVSVFPIRAAIRNNSRRMRSGSSSRGTCYCCSAMVSRRGAMTCFNRISTVPEAPRSPDSASFDVAAGVGRMLCHKCGATVTDGKCRRCNRDLTMEEQKYVGLIYHDLLRTAIRNMLRAGILAHSHGNQRPPHAQYSHTLRHYLAVRYDAGEGTHERRGRGK